MGLEHIIINNVDQEMFTGTKIFAGCLGCIKFSHSLSSAKIP